MTDKLKAINALYVHNKITKEQLAAKVPSILSQEDYDAIINNVSTTLEEMKQNKILSLSNICTQIIVKGVDVETTEGTEHFSLEETDQINLTTALSAIEQGAKGYPYHADKKLCRMFTAVEIKSIAETATAHKLYHTTLCNHLLTLARRATTTAELDAITYSADCLPIDLAENMKKVLAASGVTE